MYTIQPCHFMQSHIRKVYACLAVTCHLHFWQNDRGLLRATAVTRGWNGYRNKSQHRESTLENKILPPLLQRFEPATFQSRVRRSNDVCNVVYQAVELLRGVHLGLRASNIGVGADERTYSTFCLIAWSGRGCSCGWLTQFRSH